MKSILILTLTFVLNLFVSAQDLTLTFNGTGAAGTIDSITAINQTTGESITVPGNMLLLKDKTTGITSSTDNTQFKVWPNPFSDAANITIPIENNGNVEILVANALGQIVATASQKTNTGNCTFLFSAKEQGLYILQAKAADKSYQVSLLSLTKGTNDRLTFAGSNEFQQTEVSAGLKSATENVYLQYTPGDDILITCKSGNYATVLVDIPDETQEYTVNFDSCTDGDNNNYPIIQIGDFTFMAENLKTTKYNDGTPIPNVTDNSAWSVLSTPAYCWHNNDSSYKNNKYGALYNWFVIDTVSNGGKNVCPSGWHVPDNNEWGSFQSYLGGLLIAGGKLKETDTTHWYYPNTGATNETGFTALPAGIRYEYGKFDIIRLSGNWWSSTFVTPSYTAGWTTNYISSKFGPVPESKKTGLSIRCIKDEATQIKLPQVTTSAISLISYNSALSGGIITDEGDDSVLFRGICWGINDNPTISDSKTIDGSDTGSFTSIISDLISGSQYYVRAYATNKFGTAYGANIKFYTKKYNLPIVTTSGISSISQNSAVSGGIITDEGDDSVIVRGVCWGINDNPTTSGSKTIDGSDTGSFTSNITGLITGTLYYVRAYATNKLGTAYGANIKFYTKNYTLPIVSTSSISSISQNSTTAGGIVINDGGDPEISRGICWSTYDNPTPKGDFISGGIGTGEFTCNITGLIPGTLYYVRAYARNKFGISYGNAVQFTTLPDSISSDLYKGLVAWYPLNGNANDESGLGNHGMFNGASLTADRFGNINSALSFDGVNDYLTVEQTRLANFPVGNTPRTICSWVNSTSGTIFYYGNDNLGAPGTAFSLTLLENKFLSDNYNNNGELSYNLPDTWFFLSCIYTGADSIQLYTNSQYIGAIKIPQSLNTTLSGHISFGTRFDSFENLQYLFKGTLDDIRIYNRVLSNSEISALHNNEANAPSPLPVVITKGVCNASDTSACSEGTITSDGGSPITERGVCWSQAHNPTIKDFIKTDGHGSGDFTCKFSNLTPNTTYYLRTYAINTSGVGYGNEISFTTLPEPLPTASTLTETK